MARRSQDFTAPLDGSEPTKVDVPVLPAKPTEDELASFVRAAEVPARFQVTGLLGQGGMGYVLQAHDKRLGREVALKLLRGKLPSSARKRFEREARAVAKLQHPAIVKVYELSDDGELMVMELVRGETLHARVRREGRLPVDEVRAVGDALCRALGAAHAEGITHRDVKPANVLYETATGRILLADFGIAKMIERDGELTDTGSVLGTPLYMAPEQLRGAKVTPQADIYAVGATLFEAATGERLNDLSGTPNPDPMNAVIGATGDPGLARAIARAVSFDPRDRQASAEELGIALATRVTLTSVAPPAIRALTAAITDPPRLQDQETPVRRAVVADPPTPPRPATQPSSVNRVLPPPPEPEKQIAWGRVIAVVGVLVAIVVAIVVGIVWWRRGGSEPVAAPPERSTVVLCLPFEGKTSDPAVVYEAHTLAHRFDGELERLTMISRLPAETIGGSDPASWLAQAHRTTATHVVRGAIEERGGSLHLVVDVLHGEATQRVLDVPTRSGATAETLVAAVPVIAKALVEPHEVANYLEQGRLALVEDRVPDAVRYFATVVFHDPANSEAVAEAALAGWWNAGSPDPTRIALDKALAMPQPPPRRAVLAAYRKLIDYEPDALSTFAELDRTRPGEFHILYGLFEAQFHLGFGGDAMATYNRLRTLVPRVTIGQLHVLSYALAHPATPGLEWASELVAKEPRTRTLRARQLIYARDWAAAAKLVGSSKDREPEFELVQIQLALHDQRFDDALTRARALQSPTTALAYELAIANATGNLESIDAALTQDRLAVLDKLVDTAGSNEIAELAMVAAGLNRPALTERVQRALNKQALWAARSPSSGIARTVLGDTAPSSIPQVIEVQRALAAERDLKWEAAATAWQRAGELAIDARSLDFTRFGVARASYRGGKLAEAAAQCADVIEPRYFQAQWGVAVVDCLGWTIEDAMRRGGRDAALPVARRLVKLRPTADLEELLAPH